MSVPTPVTTTVNSSVVCASLTPTYLITSSATLFSASMAPMNARAVVLNVGGLPGPFLSVALSVGCFGVFSIASWSSVAPSLGNLVTAVFPNILPVVLLTSSPATGARLCFLSVTAARNSSEAVPFPLACADAFTMPGSVPVSTLSVSSAPFLFLAPVVRGVRGLCLDRRGSMNVALRLFSFLFRVWILLPFRL